MKNETEMAKRLYLENRKLRLLLEKVTRRLELLLEHEENQDRARRARADIRRAREVLREKRMD